MKRTSSDHPADYAVTLPVGKRPGVARVGTMKPGETHTVPAAEALRLVRDKGFEFVNAADAARCEARVKADAEAAAAVDKVEA